MSKIFHRPFRVHSILVYDIILVESLEKRGPSFFLTTLLALRSALTGSFGANSGVLSRGCSPLTI